MNKKTEKIIVILTDFIAVNLAWAVFFYIRAETGVLEFIILPEAYIPMIVVYVYWLLM